MKLLEEEEERVRREVVEAIASVCRSRISYSSDLQIDGLIGVTIDRNEVILVSVKECLGALPLALNLACGKSHAPPAAHSNASRKQTQWEDERSQLEKDYSDVPLKIPRLDFMKGRTVEKEGRNHVPEELPTTHGVIVVQPEPPEDDTEDLSGLPLREDLSTKSTSSIIHKNLNQSLASQASIKSHHIQPNKDHSRLLKPSSHRSHPTEKHKRKSDPVKCQRPDSFEQKPVDHLVQIKEEAKEAKISGGKSSSESVSSGEETPAAESCDQRQLTQLMDEGGSLDMRIPPSLSASPATRRTDGDEIMMQPKLEGTPPVFVDPESHARWLQSIATFVQGNQQPFVPEALPVSLIIFVRVYFIDAIINPFFFLFKLQQTEGITVTENSAMYRGTLSHSSRPSKLTMVCG